MDFQRRANGQPVIDGVAFRRASSFGKALSDETGIELWKDAKAAQGFQNRPDLATRLLAIDPSDTRAIAALKKEAMSAGGADTPAAIGTTIHEITAAVDQGHLDDIDVPEPYQPHVASYRRCIDDIGLRVDPHLVEVPVVCDQLSVAGTCDRFLVTSDGSLITADLKTGARLHDAPLGYMVQLAAYSRSVGWDLETERRYPIANIDQHTGLLIHLSAQAATCAAYTVDLDVSWELALLADRIHEVRKLRNLANAIFTRVA